ncbi:BolA-like protein 1 [Elsinoe fawcettii]|nr:BolA-like protein 1 [Elsinoe fawcettii]
MFALSPSIARITTRTNRLSLLGSLSTATRPQSRLSALRPTTPSLFLNRPLTAPITLRHYSAATAPSPSTPDLSHLDPAETKIHSILTDKLKPTDLEVRDVSGGCGSMYAINVTSEAFRGLSVIKQHRLVNAALKEEMAGWHGCQVRTRVP